MEQEKSHETIEWLTVNREKHRSTPDVKVSRSFFDGRRPLADTVVRRGLKTSEDAPRRLDTAGQGSSSSVHSSRPEIHMVPAYLGYDYDDDDEAWSASRDCGRGIRDIWHEMGLRVVWDVEIIKLREFRRYWIFNCTGWGNTVSVWKTQTIFKIGLQAVM